jgi:AraC-like DNA-binding protein
VLRRTFEDFDEMSAFLSSADVELIRREPGPFEGSMVRADLGRLTVGWTRHSAPLILRSTVHWRGRLFLARMGTERGLVHANGHVLDENRLIVYGPGALQHLWTKPLSDGVGVLVVNARSDDLDRVSIASSGEKFSSGPGLCTLLQPLPSAMAELRALAERSLLAVDAAGVSASAPANDAMAEALLNSLVGAVASDARRASGHEWSGDLHARLVDRTEDVMQAHLGERMYVSQLCDAGQSTERQLQRAFRAVYGVSPNRFVKLRRLHFARRALRNAEAHGKPTVGDVATRFGFDDFGRFAIAYHALFGEVPSATLARSRRN